jgi:hypothetical protein
MIYRTYPTSEGVEINEWMKKNATEIKITQRGNGWMVVVDRFQLEFETYPEAKDIKMVLIALKQ